MVEKSEYSKVYRATTNDRLVDFYNKKIEPRLKNDGTWDKWHKFNDENSDKDFICPFAFVEHCYVNGYPEKAINRFNELAEKPWEKELVGILQRYGERKKNI